MLIEFRFSNFRSFAAEQVFSMVPSSATTEDHEETSTIKINLDLMPTLLKSSAVFGANASGKSNFYKALQIFKRILMTSLEKLETPPIEGTCPFLLNQTGMDNPSTFEVSFIVKEVLYRYGLSVSQTEIAAEWLYWTRASRETLLFHRIGQTIEFNNRSFKEAKQFISIKDGITSLEKTRNTVPFLSVLANFDGEKSSEIIDWFERLRFASGLKNSNLESYTQNLFEKNSAFKEWAVNILKAVQIKDITIVEKEKTLDFPEISDNENSELSEVAERLRNIAIKNNFMEKELKVIKETSSGYTVSMPLFFESEGTIKLIYLLGALYYSIKNECVLMIDEFDSKFHTLLSRFLIDVFHNESNPKSQLILTSHDTRLLSKDLFRRDQIWFVDKNPLQESQMYSLLEYKEFYARKSDHYDRDYLAGSYGAIPLFKSVREIGEI